MTVSILERNGSTFAISSLNLSFREMLVSAMDEISELVETLKCDSSKAHDINMEVQQM